MSARGARRTLAGAFLALLLCVSGGAAANSQAPASTLTLAVIGDYGCQPGSNCLGVAANELDVARLVHSWNPQAIVTVGDNSYENGSASAVAADQGPYLADIGAGIFYPTPGNHDWQNGSIEPSTGFFHRPPHYVAHLGGGLVDLFVTDMNRQDPDGDVSGSPQASQYRANVEASTATWKITTGHQAFYSSGQHGTQDYTHWAIVPQIDLFLSGHDHDFEHLVIGGKPFVVNGVGGRNLIPVCHFGCIPGSVWHDAKHFGAVRLTVTAHSMTVDFVTVQGQVLHSFQLTRTAGAAPSQVSATPQPLPATSNTLPIRAAFYYPWFPEAWSQQGARPFTHYHPAAGFYDSSDPAVIRKHIDAMQYGGIQAGIASWWGPGSKTDHRVSALLDGAAATTFRWALMYEPEGHGSQTAAQIASNLRYIESRYAGQASYLRVDGRYVVFVYADARDGCDMAKRWSGARQLGAYVMLKIFSGYQKCANQPDGWYQYSPDKGGVSVPGQSYTVSPGFWKSSEPAARLQRDLSQWQLEIRRMIASHAPFQLVSTFNEWGEGTAAESAGEWSSASGYGLYLDALHNAGPAQKESPLSAVRSAPRENYLPQAIGLAAALAVLLLVVMLRPRTATRHLDRPPQAGKEG
jgi:hypothetical protein